jgi:hypothetical protein
MITVCGFKKKCLNIMWELLNGFECDGRIKNMNL